VCVERNICYNVLIHLLSLFQVRDFSLFFGLTKVTVNVHVYHYIVDVAAIRNSTQVLTFLQILRCIWRRYQKV
jgi:hypothetical protein